MSKTVSGTVYFDNAATTPPLPEVMAKFNELNASIYGNSMSLHHKGRQAQEALDLFHEALGRHFGLPPSHIIFTSGGTESNNLAIWGALGGLVQAFHWLKSGGTGKIITSTVEHDATKKVFEALQQMGAQVAWIGVDQEGLLDLSQLEKELDARTKLLSFHHVQNEVGAVQNLRAVSELVRSKQPDALIHVDAVQSFMKVPVNLEHLGVDLVSTSSHKIGGPKGVGALILGQRFENRVPKIGTLICGSPHQFGVRPGTVPVPAIGAFLTAVEWNVKNSETNTRQLLKLRKHLIQKLPQKTVLNGPKNIEDENPRRAPQTVSFSIPGLPSPVAVEALSARGFCVSAGAACHSTNPKPNDTLMKMGLGRERALSALRISFSAQNTTNEIDAFIPVLEEVIQQLT